MNSIQLLTSKLNTLCSSQQDIVNNVASPSSNQNNHPTITIDSSPIRNDGESVSLSTNNTDNNNNNNNNSSNRHYRQPFNTLGDSIILEDDNLVDQEDDRQDSSSSSTSGIESQFLQSKIKSFIIIVFNIVIFFPNLLILRPLFYIWFVITFPLRFLEEKYGSNDDDDTDNTIKEDTEPESFDQPCSISPSRASIRSVPIPLSTSKSKSMNDEYDDLATINSIASNASMITEINQLKSPTSPSSYMSTLFSRLPKVFFSPLNFNPIKHQKKTLILDLDETLIHSLSKTNRMSTAHMVEVKLHNNLASLYYVYKRPYCDEFLSLVSNWFELYIFTASAQEYADPVINWLEKDRKFFSKRYYRDSCTLRQGTGYIKDLSIIGIDLSKIILVDNSPISYSLNYENALDIEGWIDDPTDNELLQLLPLLNSLRFVTDVRYVLGLKNGEEAFK
ncbi:Nem1-Spo7 phosphatase catalytic subunit [Saccharomycopsis crataegensis]|uniref:Nem1-Spo7 phosphatase catalytic subunit n=1 Tax=Saccharomycopsis crataegensis TaxID=43959 RepID=A0AAV5QFS1_9ASCO|nr:Nem1-Spo7 phosphatase catalytic subunit [Saccharomycopsis crataegensis]